MQHVRRASAAFPCIATAYPLPTATNRYRYATTTKLLTAELGNSKIHDVEIITIGHYCTVDGRTDVNFRRREKARALY